MFTLDCSKASWTGFDLADSCKPELSEIVESLISSNFMNPKLIRLEIVDDPISVFIDIVVTELHAGYGAAIMVEGVEVGCPHYPSFQFIGWAVGTGFDPRSDLILVRGTLLSEGSTPEIFDVSVELSAPISRLHCLIDLA